MGRNPLKVDVSIFCYDFEFIDYSNAHKVIHTSPVLQMLNGAYAFCKDPNVARAASSWRGGVPGRNGRSISEEYSPVRVTLGVKAVLYYAQLKPVLDESRSFFRVHTGYFSNIPKCIKAEFIASWACSQSSVVSSSKR
ncbi:uncharacterized protein TNCV_5017471 [Trichonephila clavipes]|nr:uncharacterized protein TNCV_5017471 [Trichonephila clavipes]